MRRLRLVIASFLVTLVVAFLGLRTGQSAKAYWTHSGPQAGSQASIANASLPASRSTLQLLVFEAENCGYCETFRRDIAPGYVLAPLAARAPLHFIDIGKIDTGKLGLTARLDVLPTTVLLKDGHEVERITGLTSPATFYVLLKHMIAKNGA